MSEVQIAIIDQENTQIALAVPGVQGPAGAISSGGSANQVFYKVSGTNYDAGWTFIGNANVDAAAAIAGTKISPNFGSQTIATTGVFSHALGSQGAPTITFTGDTNTGIFSPGADQVAISTGGSGRLFIKSNGDVTVGHTSSSYSEAGRGLISVNGSSSSLLDLQTGTTSRFRMFCNGTTTELVNTEATGNLVFGTNSTERLRITSAGLVGIGTSSPGESIHTTGKLRVGDGGNYTVAAVQLGTSNANGISYPGTNILNFITNSTAALTIDASQRVGIGTTSPGSALEINAAAATSPFIAKINTAEAARIDSSGRLLVGTSSARSNFYNDTNSAFIQLESASNDGSALALVQNFNANTLGGQLILAKSNATSIGSNTLVASGDTCGRVSFQGNDGTQFVEAASITGEIDGTPGANDMPGRLVFSTTADGAASPTERMRIDSNGQILLNTTSTYSVSKFTADFNSSSDFGLTLRDTGSATDAVMMYFYKSGNVRGNITTNATSTAYNTSSDYRLKENVIAVTDGIIRLQKLKPSRFNFIEDPDKTVDGFIAHEVQAVVPEAIHGEKDAVDEDGNPVYQGIDQSKLVPLLTAALQEAIGEIESLKARVAALEA